MRKIKSDPNLSSLHGMKKIQYIWDYYKFPLLLICIVLYAAGYILYQHSVDREPVLYAALVNVTAGEDLTRQLGEGFLEYMGMDASEQELTLYSGLYLTDDELNENHQYAYASRMKILASIEGKYLDIVLMNREAFDAFSQNGYLCNLEEMLCRENPALYERLKDNLKDGIYIIEDNSAEILFDDSIPYHAVTEKYPMGLDLSQTGRIARAGFPETVYLGVIANSPRTDRAISYLEYLLSEDTDRLPGIQKQISHKR